jgi:hypothetical protein
VSVFGPDVRTMLHEQLNILDEKVVPDERLALDAVRTVP